MFKNVSNLSKKILCVTAKSLLSDTHNKVLLRPLHYETLFSDNVRGPDFYLSRPGGQPSYTVTHPVSGTTLWLVWQPQPLATSQDLPWDKVKEMKGSSDFVFASDYVQIIVRCRWSLKDNRDYIRSNAIVMLPCSQLLYVGGLKNMVPIS